jgi:predicted 3-demethylubiquinone-9 3-methyltransferase (glyoxalase superfamily)
MTTMPKITPFLWFDGSLDEPIAYYRSIFKDFRGRARHPGDAEDE